MDAELPPSTAATYGRVHSIGGIQLGWNCNYGNLSLRCISATQPIRHSAPYVSVKITVCRRAIVKSWRRSGINHRLLNVGESTRVHDADINVICNAIANR